MRKKYAPEHVMIRDGVYYYVRHIPRDLASIYSVTRLCFSLTTKSLKAAIRTSKSVTQRLEDYWLGLRLQNMDIPAIQVVKSGDTHANDTLRLSEACELYLRLKGMGIKTVKRVFSSIRAIVKLAIAEEGWIVLTPLQRLSFLMMKVLIQDNQYPFQISGRCNICAKT